MTTITKTCDIQAASRIGAILNGTATREQRREHLQAVLEAELAEQVNEMIEVVEDDDSVESSIGAGGTFSYVERQTLKVELEDEAALGWFVERPLLFTGSNREGLGWEAGVCKHVRRGRTLHLTLDIEPA